MPNFPSPPAATPEAYFLTTIGTLYFLEDNPIVGAKISFRTAHLLQLEFIQAPSRAFLRL
jgi:hypothetical protein